MQCDACGAPITEDPVQGFATCRYCGAKTRMRGGTVQVPAHAPRTPIALAVEAERRSRAAARRWEAEQAAPKKSGGRLIGLLILAGMFAIPAVIIGIVVGHEAGLRTFTTGAPCFVRANADDVPDLVGAGYAGDDQHVAAVDGASGSTLWIGPTVSGADKVFCADATSVLVAARGFSLTSVDARTGAERWTARLPDHVSEVGVAPADGCAVAKLADNSVVGLNLTTGATMPCPNASPPTRGDFDDDNRFARWASADGAGLHFAITQRPAGTPILTVAASEASGAVRWTLQLEARAFDSDEGGFVGFAAGRVVTVGASLGDNDRFVMTTLDPATGRVLARVEETEDDSTWHSADNSEHVWLVGNRLYTHGFVATACYDVTTLEKLWDVGM